MSQTMIQIRVEKDLKERVASVYDAVGLDLPTAIRMFFKKSILVGGLPFDGRIEAEGYHFSQPSQEYTENRKRAIAAFENLSEQARKDLDHEPTLEEINAIIDQVRKERRARLEGLAV